MNRYMLILALLGTLLVNTEKPVIVLTGQSNMMRSYDQVVLQMPDYEIINCAVGGTSITQWQRGMDVYENCVSIVRGKNVVGVFHFQGEHEAGNPDTYNLWSSLTLKFFRTFLVDIASPDATIVYAQLGSLPTNREYPYWSNIQNQQDRFNEFHPEYPMVITNDIVPYCPVSGPHWCEEGYTRIAKRFIRKYFREQGVE